MLNKRIQNLGSIFKIPAKFGTKRRGDLLCGRDPGLGKPEFIQSGSKLLKGWEFNLALATNRGTEMLAQRADIGPEHLWLILELVICDHPV